MRSICSCGEVSAHVIAQRTTDDGARFAFLSDGAMLYIGSSIGAAELGLRRDEFADPDARVMPALHGIVVAEGLDKNARAWLLDRISLFDGVEVRDLIARARVASCEART